MKKLFFKTIAFVMAWGMGIALIPGGVFPRREISARETLSAQIRIADALLKEVFRTIPGDAVQLKQERLQKSSVMLSQPKPAGTELAILQFNTNNLSLWPKIRLKVMALGKDAFGTVKDKSTWPDIENAFHSPDSPAFLLWDKKNKRPRGYIIGVPLKEADGVIDLTAVIVRETHEKQGWGGKLVEVFVRHAVRKGFERLRVETHNEKLIHLLEKTGCTFKNKTGTAFRPLYFFDLPPAGFPRRVELTGNDQLTTSSTIDFNIEQAIAISI